MVLCQPFLPPVSSAPALAHTVGRSPSCGTLGFLGLGFELGYGDGGGDGRPDALCLSVDANCTIRSNVVREVEGEVVDEGERAYAGREGGGMCANERCGFEYDEGEGTGGRSITDGKGEGDR